MCSRSSDGNYRQGNAKINLWNAQLGRVWRSWLQRWRSRCPSNHTAYRSYLQRKPSPSADGWRKCNTGRTQPSCPSGEKRLVRFQQGQGLNAAAVHPEANSPFAVQDVQGEKNRAAQWFWARRGVECHSANGICGEYTFRRRYLTGNGIDRVNEFLRRLAIIYDPILNNVRVWKMLRVGWYAGSMFWLKFHMSYPQLAFRNQLF